MQEPIAIIGIGCRFPGGATTAAAFWQLLVDGVDAIQEVPPERFDLAQVFDADPGTPGRMYTRWGGFVEGIEQFDPGFFGFSMREALRIDPQHRMLLEVAWEALEDAGLPADRLAGSPTGVFIGISTHDYADFQAQPINRSLIDAHTNSGGAGSIAANRISYIYDFRGPSFVVDTACSSSLVAVHLACQSLLSGECDLALAGGVQAVLAPELTIGFCKASMISPDGRCKAFAAEANGYVRGEGAGVIVLKRLSRALADGDPIHAVVRGSAINEDGRTNGMTVPGLPAQQQVLREAYRRAGVRPGDVHYIEAHGPGTPVGDPIEAEALATVVACERPAGEVLRIGSVKTNIGHLEAASGIAGLIKAALVVEHRQIPPSLHFRTPSPAIPFDEYRLRVVSAGEMWPAHGPALTGVNSFGFGGANAHVVLEGPPTEMRSRGTADATMDLTEPKADAASRAEMLVTSARSSESLRSLARRYRELALSADAPRLGDLISTAALHRSHHEHRLAVVGRDMDTLADNLDAFLNGETRADVVCGRAPHGPAPRVAFVFAGMGPQWWGMGRQLIEREPVFRGVIEACDRLIRRHAEWSLLDELGADESHSRVAEADFAQPVNFAFQAALLAMWKSWGIEPAAVVGHSAGEIAAVYAAGALDLEEAVRVAFYRGLLQHRATGKGRMLAVGQGLDPLRPLLAGYEGRVAVAAVNSPASVTLSGDTDAIMELNALLEKQGTFSRVMSVQVPYHSHHMDPIQADLLHSLSGLRQHPTTLPIVSEVTGDWANDVRFDAEYWWRNIRQPVLFGDAVRRLIGDGFDTFLEVSPHPVLGASVGDCLAHAGKPGVCLPSLRRSDDDRGIMLRTLGSLYVRGAAVDWEAALGRPHAHVALPLYQWNKERVWLDPTTGSKASTSGSSGHDTRVLGSRVRTVQPHWEVDLASPALNYLQDHRIHGAIVFPGAAYLAMALEAAVEIGGTSSLVLEGVEFRKALFVPDDGALRVQAVYEPGARSFRIHAENGRNGQPDGWTLHAACRLSTASAGTPPVADFTAIRERCPREMTHDEFYREVALRGFTFGPRFMGLARLSQGDGEAFGYVRLPEAHAVDGEGSRVHPALFDAGLQVLIGAVMSREQQRDGKWPAFLPTRAARVTSYRPLGSAFWSHATVEKATPEGFEGTVSIHDEEGNLLLHVEGLCAKTLEGAQTASSSEHLYRMVWEEQARVSSAAASADAAIPWCSPAAVAESVNQDADRLSRELGFAGYYHDVEPALERIAFAFFARALADLGLVWQPGTTLATDALPDGTRLTGPRRRQFEALVAALVDQGLLQATSGAEGHASAPTITVVRTPAAADDPLALVEALRAARPAYGSVLDVIVRCGLALADILASRRGAPEVLFSGDGLGVMATFYRDAPSCRLFNQLTADAVAGVVASFPAGRQLRVLEIGAGTGSATRALLPRLPEQRTRFTFTDISPLFLNLARQEIGEAAFMRYALLDIERDVRPQGFEPGSFDLVIAANVVHATSDVARTLGNIRSLLAPGGVLVLQEITRRPRWLDLVFGITDGWWAFGDMALRPTHALLDVPAWQRALGDAGLDEAAAVNEHEDAVPGQSVLVAHAPTATASAPRDPAAAPVAGGVGDIWLMLADRHGVGEQVATTLRHRGRSVVVAFAGDDALRKRSAVEYEIPLWSSEAMRELVQSVETEHGALSGVMHLWSLDMPVSTTDTTGDSLLSVQSLGYGSMLDLLHALQAAPHRRLTRVVLVTSESQAIDAATATTAVAQAPLWGFGRILLHEQPELRPLLVDCSAEPDARESEAIALEAIADEREDEVALRGARRYVHRLVRIDLDEQPRAEAAPEPARGRSFRAEVSATGSMDTRLRTFARSPLGPGEIEIEVKAASLNFRDVVFALGVLPAEAFENSASVPGAMGIDCAGVVIGVGEGVTEVSPGDEVMAVSAASLASHARTRDVVVRKPAGLSFEEAAALPLAYVTAIYALETVARLKRGERVLIHSATGGVGLAAIAVAKRAGAEIFATAGTEAKREYLRSNGISHVMDSRSLEFADQVMAATGGRGVDVVLNSLAGEAIAKGLSVLAPRGRFLELGKADIYRNGDLPLEAFRRNLSFVGIQIDSLCDGDRGVLLDALRNTLHGIEDGTLAPLPTQVFPIAGLEDGLRTLAQARHIGKLVIALNDPDVPIYSQAAEVPLFRADATYLITGGRGGVGVALADWAAERGVRHIALMSRHASADEGADDVMRMRARGVEVLLVDADASRPADVARAIDVVDRVNAPLKGVFHGAMVIDDAPLSELDRERFERVMAPKAVGAWNLHLATRDRALDHFVMFSSITAVYGNARQGNYGAANAFLGSLAGYRRAQGLPGLTVDWGVFSDVGYVATRKELGEFLARQGQFGLSAEHGFAAMAALMERGVVQATISRTDWPLWAEANPVMGASPRFQGLVRERAAADSDRSAGRAPARVLEALLGLEAAGLRPAVLQHLQRRVARILGTAPERVEFTVPLTDMGMDSLMAVELMTMLKNDLAFDMPAVRLLQRVSIEQVADRVLEHLQALGHSAPGPASTTAHAPLAAPTDTIESLQSLESLPRVDDTLQPDGVTTGATPTNDRHATPALAPTATKVSDPVASRDSHAASAGLRAPSAQKHVADSGQPILDYRHWTPFQRFARAVVTRGVGCIANVRIDGALNIPSSGPVVLAANHVSMWDAPVLLQIAERRTVMFAAEELRRKPWVHWTLHKIWDAIYLKRGDGDTEALDQALAVLRGGGMLGLAPEGHRSVSGMRRGLTGAAYLAYRSGAPIVPVAVFGQERIPADARRFTRAQVHVRIGTPMPVPHGEPTAQALRAYTDRAMIEVARMLPPAYRGFYAPDVEKAEAEDAAHREIA